MYIKSQFHVHKKPDMYIKTRFHVHKQSSIDHENPISWTIEKPIDHERFFMEHTPDATLSAKAIAEKIAEKNLKTPFLGQ